VPATPSKGRRTVGVFHSSSPANRSQVRQGLQRLKKLGFDPVVPASTQKNGSRPESRARKFLAGKDQEKIRAFLQLWKNPKIRTLFPLRGGYGTLRLLDALVAAKIRRVPGKAVWGFSDLTSLQNWLYGHTGAPWVHSPMLTSVSFREPNPLEKRVWNAYLSETETHIEHPLTVSHRPRGTAPSIEAPLIGGNFACFLGLLGTRWEPKAKDPFFFFIEEIDEPAYRLDRWLHQLRATKLWPQCRGIILGHFTQCPGAEAVIRQWARDHDVLLLEGLPAGHATPNVPITMGMTCCLEFQKNDTACLRMPIIKFG